MTGHTPSTKTNIIANFAGKAWSGIINLAFVPLYIKFLGIEAYGLIGIFVSLIALLSILDMGLSATLNRELARLAALPNTEREARNLTRTFEVIYWAAGVLIGLIVLALAPVISLNWIQARSLPRETVQHALMMMGLIVAIQWPCSLYAGGLAGLQRQVLMNIIRSAIGTIQAVGAVLVLWLVSPTIYAYFTWQLVVSIVQTAVFAYSLRKSLPEYDGKTVFDRSLVAKNFRFAAGMTGISLVVTILTQADKVILSKILPLNLFGYYILAVNVGSMVNYLVHPVATAVFPKYSQLANPNTRKELAAFYHKGCQITSIIVLPAAVTLVFFANDILMLWLRDAATVQNASGIVKIIVIGSTLNALMTLPYNLQLAHGWTRLSFYKNVLSVLLLIPLLLVLVHAWSTQGAALVWVILNAGYFLIEVPLMHRMILKGEMKHWYLNDVGIPLLVTLFIVAFSRLFYIRSDSPLETVLWIAATGTLALVTTVLALPASRTWLLKGAAR